MNRGYLSTIYYFIKLYKRLFVLVLLFSIFVAILESFSLAALLPVFSSMLGVQEDVGSNFLIMFIKNILKFMPFNDSILAALALVMLLTIVKSICGIFNEFLIAYTTGKIVYDTKKRIFEKYVHASYQFFLETKHGELLYNVINAPKVLWQVFYRLPRIAFEGLKVAAIILLLVYLNIYVTLVFILLSVIFGYIISLISNKLSYVYGKERINLEKEQTTLLNEIFNGIKQIIVYGAIDNWCSKFNKANKQSAKLYVKDYSLASTPRYVIDVFGFFIMFSVVLFLKKLYPSHFLKNLPVVGIFAMALIRLLPSLGNIGRLRMEIVGALPDAELMYKVLDCNIQNVGSGHIIFNTLNSAIVFKDVNFTYKGRQELLKNINIVFSKNKVTAIVGATGSGKTTIINLILGLFEPTAGKIIIDGVGLQDYEIETWRKRIGFVSQDAFTFHSTIEENISLGMDIFSREEIINAAKIAGVDEFVKHFPDGYNTIVGERGMKLSGGQQQCIAIARAIIRNPEILILDEATSALDNISERLIQNAINNISKNYTVIIIAHRLSTVQNADKIIALRHGMVVEEGTHSELISKGGLYRDMCLHQGCIT